MIGLLRVHLRLRVYPVIDRKVLVHAQDLFLVKLGRFYVAKIRMAGRQ